MGLELQFTGKRLATVFLTWWAKYHCLCQHTQQYGEIQLTMDLRNIRVKSVVLLTLHSKILHEALRFKPSIQRQKVIVYGLLLAPQRIHTELQVANCLSGLKNSHTQIRTT
jgi:hypothetical protein